MSKSLGNVLDPNEVIERFGADALRFYCMREVSFGQDGSVSAAGFESRYETELANDWGNLASRTLAMIERYRDGVVPEARGPGPGDGDDALEGSTASSASCSTDVELTQALEAIWARVRRLNRYVEETKPWELAKDEAQAERLDHGPLQPRRGDPGPRAAAASRTCPRPAAGCSRRSPRATASSTRSAPAAAAARIERIAPLFPKLDG